MIILAAVCSTVLLISDASGPVNGSNALAVVRAKENARLSTIAEVERSVAALFARGGSGGGSGVIIDPEGYGLTNFHVVAPMLEDRVGEAGLSDHRKYELEVLGIDPYGDVAMFKLRGIKPFVAAELGDSDTARVGDEALALGNPFLLAEDYTPTITFGIISGLQRYQWGSGKALVYTDCIQVDTSINPGNSGGPLFDMRGRVIGINGRVSIEERGRVNVGVGYAITINQIKRFIPALRAGLVARHAAAGFTVLNRGGKVYIERILETSAAWRAGLRGEDRIVRLAGKDMRSANQFVSLLGTFPGGWPIEVLYERAGVAAKAAFRLDDMPLPNMRHPDGRFDPLAGHPKSQAANRRAVRRALRAYRKSISSESSLEAVGRISLDGQRVLTANPLEPSSPLHLTEARPFAPSGKTGGAEAEQTIRWSLLEAGSPSVQETDRVVGADDVAGRVCVVLERESVPIETAGEPIALTHRLSFDDADGRLLALEFKDPVSGRQVRYEYDDYRRCGVLRLPHLRRLMLDGKPFAEDTFTRIEVGGKER